MNEYNMMQPEDEEELEIDLGVLLCDMWKGLKKLWWVFLIICGVAAGINCAQRAARYVPMYESKISFTVSTQSGYDEGNTSYGFYYNQSTAEQLEKLFPYLLQSDVMQAMLKEELGTDYINGSISAKAVPNSNLFTMKVTSGDRDAAMQILEAAMDSLPRVSKYVIGETKLNIIQPVTTPKSAYNKPNYRRAAAKGFLAGAVLCGMILGVYALFRRTVRKEEDFQSVLNMRCFGVVPQVKFKKHGRKIDKRVSILNEKSGRPFRESVRSMSLKLERRMKENNQKVLLITSTLPGEGKSTTAANLALALGERGKKVLLLDLDLRNPSQRDNLLAKTKAAGLEQVLDGSVPPEKSIQKLEQGIYFMGAQNACKKVQGLLTKSALKKLIQKYREEMDYIIVDTPPCGAISDAVMISQLCDGVLYVIRQDCAKKWQILDGMQQITSYGIKILGGVLNGAENSLSGYGYSYYGKYVYGSYGYGKNKKDGKKR